MDIVKIGLLGCGVVGSGVVKQLLRNQDEIAMNTGCRFEIKRILVRDLNKQRSLDLPREIFTDQAEDILNDPEIQIVVELMGGIEPAKNYILAAFAKGKNVVTANKDVLAAHGQEIFAAAAEYEKDIRFEASVAGGIPIIQPLKESLAGNRIKRVLGIVNGTTNYILTKMSMEGKDFAEALTEAQELGYAEADPSADVDGLDAARKIAILASIAFRTRVSFDQVYVEGIRNISTLDIAYAKELGYTIKLLGVAQEVDGEVDVRVHPVLIPDRHPLASVNDVYNAVFVEGDAVGQTMFFGPGAGEFPTASSVVGDIMAVGKHVRLGITGRLTGCTCYYHKHIRSIGRLNCSYYLRLLVQDQPGVLAKIAGVLAEHQVSIASVLQKRTLAHLAEIVIVTHQVIEADFRAAMAEIRDLPPVDKVDSVIRVESGE
ncbi:MAG: homoserine dehydrogenase [Clostridia bacterium]|nr:homoserine dehydrogenase [Clostridia bacterium]